MRDRTTSVKGHPVDHVAPSGTNVLFDVWLTAKAASGFLDAALAPSGLTADEFGLYSVLTSADTLTPTELARWLHVPTTTVSSTIKRLEARGHLRRERNPDDGRSFVLRLTPAGRAAHRAAGAAFLPALERVVATLDRREAGVRRSLRVLREAIDVATDADADADAAGA